MILLSQNRYNRPFSNQVFDFQIKFEFHLTGAVTHAGSDLCCGHPEKNTFKDNKLGLEMMSEVNNNHTSI